MKEGFTGIILATLSALCFVSTAENKREYTTPQPDILPTEQLLKTTSLHKKVEQIENTADSLHVEVVRLIDEETIK